MSTYVKYMVKILVVNVAYIFLYKVASPDFPEFLFNNNVIRAIGLIADL